jgi:Xaa-Pro aminopeptidase
MLLNEERAREVMERHGLDAFVATTGENVHYLSDYASVISHNFSRWTTAAAIFPRDPQRPPTLVCREMDVYHAAHTWVPNLRVQRGFSYYVPEGAQLSDSDRQREERLVTHGVSDFSNFQRLVGQTILDLGLGKARLGFDDCRIMLDFSANELADADLVEAVNVLREVRIVKTEPEIKRMREASLRNQIALESTATLASEGRTTGELIRHFRAVMNLYGGYGSHVTGGGDANPWMHHDDLGYRLKPGDHMLLDPAGTYQFYWGDQARNVALEPIDPKLQEIAAVLIACHGEIVPLMQPGANSFELEAHAREFVKGTIAEPGFLPLFHSIGLEQYDQPQALGEFFSEPLIFEPNMTINLEALYYELGWGAMNIEDTFLITPAGPERLGTLPLDAFIR